MRILYGTGNSGKLMVMKRYTQGLPLEIAPPSAWGFSLPQVEETGKDPLENARIKAYAYYKAFGVPTLSCDSGLYFDNVPDIDQPGVHVRVRGGVTLDDEQMIAYYSGLARRYGGLHARYRNAACLILDRGHVYESMAEDLSGLPFLITDTPHPKRISGFPLDSLSVHIPTGKYYFDLEDSQIEVDDVSLGFRRFFEDVLHEIGIY